MLIIKFNGGIGNQLFQYAFFLYCKKNDLDAKVDLTIYDNQQIHGGFLLPFIIKNFYEKVDFITIDESHKYNKKNIFDKIFCRIFHYYRNHYLEAYFSSYKKIIPFLKKKSDKIIYLEGYWQFAKIVNNVLPELKNEIFNLQYLLEKKFNDNKFYFKLLKNIENKVSIHVRRGDYVSNKNALKHYGNICTKEYYYSAIKYMKTINPNFEFVIFSDSYDYACGLFDSKIKCTFSDNLSPEKAFLDIFFMSLCPYHILANSTFSWWGAVLSNAIHQTVMPQKFDNTLKENNLIIDSSIVIDSKGTLIKNEK